MWRRSKEGEMKLNKMMEHEEKEEAKEEEGNTGGIIAKIIE